MKSILIIEPYVYVKQNKIKVIFYNTIDGGFLEYFFNNEIWTISGNIIKIEVSELSDQYNNLVLNLAKRQMAYEYEGNKIFEKNIFEKLQMEFNQRDRILKLTSDDLFRCIFSITICMNDISASVKDINCLKKQIEIFSNADKCNKLIKIDSIMKVFTNYSFPNLNSVTLVGSRLFEIPSFYDLLVFLKKLFKVKLFVTYSEYAEYFKYYIQEIEYHLICDDTFYEKFPNDYEKFLGKKNIYINMYISNEKEISFLEKHESRVEQLKFVLTPYYSNNRQFLEKHISYTKKDLFEKKKSIMKIIRNSLINELFFGSFVIHNDGEIFSNIQTTTLGNIENCKLSDIIFKASEDNSSWLYSRQLHPQCSNCLFNCLCPPVSSIELASELVFCKNIR